MTRVRVTGFLAGLLLFSSTALADEAPLTLRLEVDRNEVPQGETVRLDVVLTVRSQQQVEELSLPEIPQAFTIMQERRATSTQVGSVNGKRTVTVEQRFMFVLRGDDAGTFRIGDASARLGRAVARAAPVTIKVTPGDVDPASETGDAQAGSSGPQPGARFGKDVPAAFLEVTVDKQEAWLGEQITVTTEVYTQQPLSQWPRMAPLKPAGFFCVPLLGDDRPSPGQRTVNGRLYYVYLVNKDALFATGHGAKTIPAQSVDLVPAGSFFSRSRDVQVKSPKMMVNVKPLPDDPNRPESFSPGNVGHWTLSASVRPQTATPGQPFTLTIAATGTGNVDQLQLPTWDGGTSARVFPPTSRIERRPTSATDVDLGGRVVAEMLVQPLREGDIKIPPFALATFDPDKGEYRTSTTSTIVVPVKAAKNAAAMGVNGASSGRQVIAKGARPLHARATMTAAPTEVPVVVGASAAALGALAWLGGSARRRQRASASGQRDALLKERAKALTDARQRGDLATLERIVLDALADRYGPSVKACATSALDAELTTRGAERALIDDVVRFIQDVEAARYMRGGAPGERERMGTTAAQLVGRVERGAT